jgi:hypothetical protein
MSYPVERSYYRINYPLTERPMLVLEGRQYPVIDCSEHGLRFVRSLSVPLEVGDRVQGLLKFRRGAEADVEGDVVRVQADHAALHLKVAGIPLSIILDEQRYLRVHYPMRF